MAQVPRLARESIKKRMHSTLSAADLFTPSDLKMLDTILAGATKKSRVYATATSPAQSNGHRNDHTHVKS